MKSSLKILVVFTILGGIIILGLEFLCRVEIKCKSCSKTSLNKEESITDGFYLGEYRALSKKSKT